jgi:uncharacterized protein with HEPN domain
MRTARLLLQDILDSIAEVIDTTPATQADFDGDKLKQSHVLRHLAIIGEASSRLPKPLRDANPQIPWRGIIDMRNILIHAYHGINWQRVYETARDDAPCSSPRLKRCSQTFLQIRTLCDPQRPLGGFFMRE